MKLNGLGLRIAAVLALCLMLVATCFAGEAPVSAEAGDQFFHSRSLGSPYTTGIPYALWLAMMERYPEELGANWGEFRDKFGLLEDPARPAGLPPPPRRSNSPGRASCTHAQGKTPCPGS